MQLSGRPLLDNAADQALFVGREEVLRKIDRSLRSGLNCVVVGEPGSGKTSLVRALMFRTQTADPPLRITHLRANEARTAVDLLTGLLAAVDAPVADGPTQPTPSGLLDVLVAVMSPDPDTDSDTGARLGLRVIVVEDVSGAAGAELFGALRDELWQVDAQWLVTTSSVQAGGLLRPPADVFFETRIELGPLTTQEATELLRLRLDQPDSADLAGLRQAAEAARQTPRRLLEVARELSAEPAVGGLRLTTVAGLRARAVGLEQLSRPARMLAAELEALGWASASDPRLLGRMGWTRPRVVQVVAELESRGLVQMREENTGRGRPRKLYRLTPAAEFIEPDDGTAVDPALGPAEPDDTGVEPS